MRRTLLFFLATAFLVSTFPAQAASKGVFYLDLKNGCYSASKSPTKPYKWSESNYKTLYPTSCATSHHYEVYAVTKLTAKDLTSTAAQDEGRAICTSKARVLLANQDEIDPNITFAFFFPDPGAETKKYGKKLICFFRSVDPKNDQYSVSIKSSFIVRNYI